MATEHHISFTIQQEIPRPVRNDNRNGFTLIELLVVMGIIALIIGISVPAFQNINRGSNIRTAESQIRIGAMLARQQSVTSRQQVTFCIPITVEKENPYVRPNMLYRSYLLYTEKKSNGVKISSSVIGKVESLPKGVVFGKKFDYWQDVQFTDTDNAVLFTGKGIRYSPTGSIDMNDAIALQKNGLSSYKIVLMEGDVSDKGIANYKSNGIKSTSLIHTVSGRCTLKEQ